MRRISWDKLRSARRSRKAIELFSLSFVALSNGNSPALLERWISSIPDLDLDSQDALGWTLLHTAISSSYDCARILLEHGAAVDAKDTILGWTPLHHACNEGNQEGWNLLLDYGADFFLRDNLMGWTPMNLLEQSMDSLRLESGETWIDEEGNPVDDIDEEAWQDEAGSNEDEDEAQPLDPVAREQLAKIRANLRSRISKFFAEESMRRMVRPVKQADYDREVDIARASVFPEHRYLEETSAEADGPLRIRNSRNLPRIHFVCHQGVIRKSAWTSPAVCSIPQPSRVWLIDSYGTIHGLSGLD
jgi:hypothetical protein